MQKTDSNIVPQSQDLIMSAAQLKDGCEHRKVLGMQLNAKTLQLQMHSSLNLQGENNGWLTS